ncbi:MAG TPA: septum formation initiator family protein [Candidatus Paceibacterota bacterium]
MKTGMLSISFLSLPLKTIFTLMTNFHQKRKLKRFLYSPIVLIPLALVVFFLGVSVSNVYKKEQETRIRRDKQTAELRALEVRAEALQAELEKLSSERGVESEIRSKFEVAKENEHVIVIVDPEQETEDTAPPSAVPFWQKVLNWF